jgi:myosin-5
MTAGADSYPPNAEQAVDLRDAFAKGIYSQLFDWLVGRVNSSVSSRKEAACHIGLLDIFCFESFDNNGVSSNFVLIMRMKSYSRNSTRISLYVQSEYIVGKITHLASSPL